MQTHTPRQFLGGEEEENYGRVDGPPTPQQSTTTMGIRGLYNRGIVFGKDGGCLSGPSIYVLPLGLLTDIKLFLSYSWDDGLFQPVVHTAHIPAKGKLQPYHYFSYEVISDSSFTVTRLVKVQRMFRERLNAPARLAIQAVAKGCAPRVVSFDSLLHIVQSEAVFAMLAYAPRQGRHHGPRKGHHDGPRKCHRFCETGCDTFGDAHCKIRPMQQVRGAGFDHIPVLSTMMCLRRKKEWTEAIDIWRGEWPVQPRSWI